MSSVDPGDETLLGAFRAERPRLWGFFLRGSGSPEAAEDLLQETFLRLWDHRGELTGESPESMRAYLWRIARNGMIDEIRARVRHRAAGESAGGPPQDQIIDSGEPGPAGHVEHQDALRVLRDTVARLPNPRARRCLELWLDGRSLPGIAREVGMAVGQVRGLLQRGKAEVILRATDRLRAPATARGESTA